MTQKQRVYQYILENGSLTPAVERTATYHGKLLGSQMDRRCRELRTEGLVKSTGVGRFEKFYVETTETAVKEAFGITEPKQLGLERPAFLVKDKKLEYKKEIRRKVFFAKSRELGFNPELAKERAKHPRSGQWNVAHFSELMPEQLDVLIGILEAELFMRTHPQPPKGII